MNMLQKYNLTIERVYRPDVRDGKKYQVLKMYNLVNPALLKTFKEKKDHALQKIKALNIDYKGCYIPMVDLNIFLGTSIRWGSRTTTETERLPGVLSRHLKMTNKKKNTAMTGRRRCLMINDHLVTYIETMDENLGMVRKPYISKEKTLVHITPEPTLFDSPADVIDTQAERVLGVPPRSKEDKSKTPNQEDDVVAKPETKQPEDDVVGLLMGNDMKALFKDMEITKGRIREVIVKIEIVNVKINSLHSKVDALAYNQPASIATSKGSPSTDTTTDALLKLIVMMNK